MPLVECRLSKVVVSETHDRQLIMLQEIDGERQFPIIIGFAEAYAIHRFVNGETPPRPLTHELIASIMRALDVQIERVVVSELRDTTFYARLIMRANDKVYEVDSRPSDAIALASQAGAPIFVEESVIGSASKEFA